ncbi:MAG TPA: nucleotidyltransferase domain-containing protein [Drouetiella sp.]
MEVRTNEIPDLILDGQTLDGQTFEDDMEQQTKLTPESAAREILESRFPQATVMFLAGSLIRGEATRFSDLDLVVVFDHVSSAYRESFYYRGWPVEAFVHDVETLKYFFYEVDGKAGFAALPQMVLEGTVITAPNDTAAELKLLAQQVIDAGPPALAESELEKRRYEITDLIDDIREPRSRAELMATGALLLNALADFYFRSHGMWSASGKRIFRKLGTADVKMQKEFEYSFSELFAEANSAPCIELAERVLKEQGGFLFDGYKSHAPVDWRKED